MNQVQIDKIKQGYASLEYSIERTEIKKFIDEFDKANEDTKKNLLENLSKITNKSLGPLSSSGCPCCGKS